MEWFIAYRVEYFILKARKSCFYQIYVAFLEKTSKIYTIGVY